MIVAYVTSDRTEGRAEAVVSPSQLHVLVSAQPEETREGCHNQVSAKTFLKFIPQLFFSVFIAGLILCSQICFDHLGPGDQSSSCNYTCRRASASVVFLNCKLPSSVCSQIKSLSFEGVG